MAVKCVNEVHGSSTSTGQLGHPQKAQQAHQLSTPRPYQGGGGAYRQQAGGRWQDQKGAPGSPKYKSGYHQPPPPPPAQKLPTVAEKETSSASALIEEGEDTTSMACMTQEEIMGLADYLSKQGYDENRIQALVSIDEDLFREVCADYIQHLAATKGEGAAIDYTVKVAEEVARVAALADHSPDINV